MSEALFRKRIKDLSQSCGFDAHWQSIESAATGQGIPDLNGCCNGTEVWIETKYTEHQKTKNIGIKPMQIAWIYKHAKAGSNIWIALYMKTLARNTGLIFLWKGKVVQQVNELGTSFPPFAIIRVKNVDDWKDFYNIIFKNRIQNADEILPLTNFKLNS